MTAAFSLAAVATADWKPGAIDSIWNKFQRRVRTVVHEFNSEAGETIWTVVEPLADLYRLEVASQSDESARVELSLDRAASRLRCVFQRPRGISWTFEIQVAGDLLRRKSRRYTIEQAVDAVLDQLVVPIALTR